MRPRLLKKSEVDQAKAKDRQREIEEGLKIARRVDNLRETHAEEEASLEKFRSETISRINEEITKVSDRRDELKVEVAYLEKRKNKALESLSSEWENLEKAQEKVEKEKEVLAQEKEEIRTLKKEAKAARNEAEKDRLRASDASERQKILLAEADQSRKEAKESLRHAEIFKEEAILLKKTAQDEIIGRKKAIALKERELIILKERLDEREKRQNVRDAQINDRAATLERAFNRLNKGHG